MGGRKVSSSIRQDNQECKKAVMAHSRLRILSSAYEKTSDVKGLKESYNIEKVLN